MFKDFVYERYLKEPNAISFEEAMKIYEEIIAQAPEENEMFDKAWDEAIEKMTAYADLRAHWKITPKSERDNDARTVKHDSVISSLNQLAQVMKELKLDASWREELGDQRKRIGDFACYVSLIYGVFAR